MNDLDLFGHAFAEPVHQRRRAGMGSHQAVSSITDEWITPRGIIHALGSFDLDPCSPGDRRPWDTARTHYSAELDGLRQPWSGRVWLNPPYSDAGRWLARLVEHGQGTALIFARTETATWFEHVWPRASALLFVRGRLTFHHLDGSLSGYNAGAPSVLVAYGDADAQLLERVPIFGQYVDLRAQRRSA